MRPPAKKDIVIITGAKIVKARRRFDTSQDVTYLEYGGDVYKMNSAAGVVYVLAQSGYTVFVQVTSELTKEVLVSLGIVPDESIWTGSLNESEATDIFVRNALAVKEPEDNVSVVHYGSASEVAHDLPESSLAVSVWDTPAEGVHALIDANIVTLYNLMQSCKRCGVFEQEQTKVIPISAIAAIRARVGFGLDNIQKAAGHALTRTLALELAKENIHITELLVGSLDGGYYDNDTTLQRSIKSSQALGYEYEMDTKPVFSAEQVGEAVHYVIEARCNVRQLVIAPYGQYPQMGS